MTDQSLTGSYSALVLGSGSAGERIARAWSAEPAIRSLHHVGGSRESLRAIERCRPDIVALVENRTAPALLAAAANHGARGAYLDPSHFSADILDACNRVGQRWNIKTVCANSFRHSHAYATLADKITAGSLGRLLEIRCTVADPAAMAPLVRCREGIALAVACGGLPRSCHARMYRGAERLSNELASAVESDGILARGTALHASLRLSDGVTFHLDCNRTSSGSDAVTYVAFVGTRGMARIVAGTPPTAEWRAVASWSAARPSGPWQPLKATEPHCESCESAALRDLIGSLESDREPLSSLTDICGADRALQLVFHAHRLEHRVSGPLRMSGFGASDRPVAAFSRSRAGG